MGEVYRAKDTRLDRDVAIKVMAPHIAADPEMRRRFETEARAIASLSHPSILAIHELAIVDGLPVAVMELLEGQTLRSRLKQGPCRGATPQDRRRSPRGSPRTRGAIIATSSPRRVPHK
jgi:serine/threonine protein kinase